MTLRPKRSASGPKTKAPRVAPNSAAEKTGPNVVERDRECRWRSRERRRRWRTCRRRRAPPRGRTQQQPHLISGEAGDCRSARRRRSAPRRTTVFRSGREGRRGARASDSFQFVSSPFLPLAEAAAGVPVTLREQRVRRQPATTSPAPRHVLVGPDEREAAPVASGQAAHRRAPRTVERTPRRRAAATKRVGRARGSPCVTSRVKPGPKWS